MPYVATPQLAHLLTRARRAQGWDMNQAAEATGLAISTVSNFETAKFPGRPIQRTTLEKLADGYRLDDDELQQAAAVEHLAAKEQPALEPASNGHSNGIGPRTVNGDGNTTATLARLFTVWPHLTTDEQATLVDLADGLTYRK